MDLTHKYFLNPSNRHGITDRWGGAIGPSFPVIICCHHSKSSSGASFWPLNNERPDEGSSPSYPAPPENQDSGMYAHQEAEVGPPTGNGESEGEECPRPPTPPAQQLPVYEGMERQQGHALAFPIYYYAPDHLNYAVPPPHPNAYPLYFADPYTGFYYEFLNANHYVFHSADFYTQFACFFPYTLPYDDPYTMPHPYLYAVPSADPFAFPQAPRYPGFHANPNDALDGHYDYDENMDGVEISHFNATDLVRSVENIGPLTLENASEEFSSACFFSSFPEASEYPSTSGISSSTRRCREESSDEEASKRPRWSPESDSD